jgi:hypothetical protein
MTAKLIIAATVCVLAGAAAIAIAPTGGAHQAPARLAPASERPLTVRDRLVGRWERVNTCRELVRALDRYGLRATAPAMIAGNGYVPGTPRQIARRSDPCKGAVARRHSHFFRDSGQFGSVDYRDEQVDEGPWAVVGTRRLKIGSPPLAGGRFRVRIRDGRLHLRPLITAAQRRKALAHPLQFSSAGWMVSVAFPGHAWTRVPCDEWC